MVTDKRHSIGGTSSELISLKGVRYAVMQEPSKGSVLNEGVVKEDYICAEDAQKEIEILSRVKHLLQRQPKRVSREEFEKVCDSMRCADILSKDSTYGDVARFVLLEIGVEVEEEK